MADLARGTVTDRPWGRTLAALGLRGVTGQLTVIHDAKPYRIVFAGGAVAAASSPLASDAAVRVALTGHLVSSTQVAEISRKQAAAPQRDEIDVMAEAVRLAPEQALRLRRRVIAQRAARTFALNSGDFVVRDEVELPLVEGCELDIRSVIYLGAKQMLPEVRLASDLAQYGTWFQLKTDAVDDLPQFGFGPDEQGVLALLGRGVDLAELEQQPDIDARIARAVVYALVSCNAVLVEGGRASTAAIPVPRASAPVIATPVARRPPSTPPPRRAPSTPPPRAMAPDAPTVRGKSATSSPPRQPPTPPPDPATIARTPRPGADRAPAPQAIGRQADATQTAEVEQLIKARLSILEKKPKGDHFQLLGLSRDATAKQIRDMYFQLARQLHPDRLSALGISDDQKRAQRLMAEVNSAFAVLSDPTKKAAYADILSRGGEAAVRAEEQKAEDMAMRILDSEEAFRRGEMALKRDSLQTAIRELEAAIALNPDEPDYHATLAWARFAAAPDKMAVAAATRAELATTIKRSPRAVAGKFFLGRVERMLGKDQDALRLFKEVLEVEPSHPEASSEIRVLEARLGGDKGGLFGRSKR